MRKLAYIALMILCAAPALAAAPVPSEENYFARIKKLYEEGKSVELDKLAAEFFKRYPRTERVPDVRLMAAELDSIPESALRRYRILVDNYRYFDRRDYAQYRICEIQYLLSRWDELITESKKGIALSGSTHAADFRLMLAKAYVYRERYDEASKACDDLVESRPQPAKAAEALLLQAYIERKTAGFSRGCVKRLADIVRDYPDSEAAPAALYMLGRSYEEAGDYNRGWSAYQDVMKKYPKSQEARFALGRSEGLGEFKPVYTAYLPDEKRLERKDTIDISPEYDVPEGPDAKKSGVAYSVSLGPFTDSRSCGEIRDLIRNDFSPLETVRVGGRYILYVGVFRDGDAALPCKIRLAEEYGINGSIVRIRRDKTRRYIYGE